MEVCAMKQTLVIHGRLPGLNEYINANRANRFAGAKMKKDTQAMIWASIAEKAKPMQGKVCLDFRWYEPNTRRDLDNCSYAKKFILDTLVEHHIIETDGWRGVEGFTDKFYVCKDQPRIEVDIEEVGIWKENC